MFLEEICGLNPKNGWQPHNVAKNTYCDQELTLFFSQRDGQHIEIFQKSTSLHLLPLLIKAYLRLTYSTQCYSQLRLAKLPDNQTRRRFLANEI